MSAVVTAKAWLKQNESPAAKKAVAFAKAARRWSVPSIRPIHAPLYALHMGMRNAIANLARVFWTTPLFKSRITGGDGLYLYSGLPVVMGPLDIEIGANVRLSGITTLSGRSASRVRPSLKIGTGTGIGWQTTIAVGTRVVIGDYCNIAGKSFLAGYPGHPVDADARARGLPDSDDQCGDIILGDKVWLASGVTVMAGVTIGSGSIIAAGSVVTKDVPPGVLAGGMPARVIRRLDGKPLDA